MYSFTDKDGNRDLTIEQSLSKLEGMFERVRRDKIMQCEPLSDEDEATLFLFVAAAHFRTPKIREHWKRQLGEAVELGDQMKTHIESLSPEEKAALRDDAMPPNGPTFSIEDLRPFAEQPLQRMLPIFVTAEANLLSYMTPTIFCTADDVFITSDAPVVWFDPESYKLPRFYRNPALGSETIEVTMPIAPNRLLLLTHGRATDGYVPIVSKIDIGVQLIDDVNRRTRFHCDEYFIFRSNEKKAIWLLRASSRRARSWSAKHRSTAGGQGVR